MIWLWTWRLFYGALPILTMNKAGTGSARDATELGSGQLNNQAALPKARSKSDSPRKRQAYGQDQGNESGRRTRRRRNDADHLAVDSDRKSTRLNSSH